MLLVQWFSASGSKFSDLIFSHWAACLLFAISSTGHAQLSSLLLMQPSGESESCVWPQTEWWLERGDSISVISPSSVTSTLVCPTPTFSLFVSISFLPSLHWNPARRKKKKKSVCERVSICVSCVCSNNCVSVSVVALCTRMAMLRSCQVDKKKKKKGKLQKHLLEKSTTVEVIVWGKTLPLLLLSTLWTSRETQQEHRVEAL